MASTQNVATRNTDKRCFTCRTHITNDQEGMCCGLSRATGDETTNAALGECYVPTNTATPQHITED